MHLEERTRQLNRKYVILLLLVLFAFTLWISWGFPPTGDDWNRLVFKKRTLEGFVDLVKNHYETLNGRVLGNILSYVLIKPPIVRYLAKAVSILALTVLAAKLSRIKRPIAFLLGFFFVMTAPRLIFVQVYSWSSGFFNYVPPMIGVLFIFVQMMPLFDRKPMKDGALRSVGYFFLGICTCLFVEHVTLFTAVLSIAILALQIAQAKKPAISAIAFSLGTALGTVIMFASPIYRKILFADDSYRTVPKTGGDFIDILLQNYRSFSRYLLFENPVFFLIVCVVCIFALHHVRKRGALARVMQIWFGIVPTLVILTRVFLKDVFNFSLANMQRYYFLPVAFDFLLHLLTFACLIFTGLFVIRKVSIRRQYVFLLLSIPVIVAPLFVVRPVLARNYYASYLFLALAILLLVREILHRNLAHLLSFSKWTVLVTAGLCLFYGVVYTLNKISFEKRIDVIEAGMEQKLDIIIIPDYPVPFFVFGPGDSSLGHMYYYEKANDISFVLESEKDTITEPVETQSD